MSWGSSGLWVPSTSRRRPQPEGMARDPAVARIRTIFTGATSCRVPRGVGADDARFEELGETRRLAGEYPELTGRLRAGRPDAAVGRGVSPSLPCGWDAPCSEVHCLVVALFVDCSHRRGHRRDAEPELVPLGRAHMGIAEHTPLTLGTAAVVGPVIGRSPTAARPRFRRSRTPGIRLATTCSALYRVVESPDASPASVGPWRRRLPSMVRPRDRTGHGCRPAIPSCRFTRRRRHRHAARSR
jgi:hypothetical protein